MSAEAYEFVWNHGPASGFKGTHLVAVLLMARISKERKAPFTAELAAQDLANYANITLRQAQRVLSDLASTNHIQSVSTGVGGLKSIYSFGQPYTTSMPQSTTTPVSYRLEESTPEYKGLNGAA